MLCGRLTGPQFAAQDVAVVSLVESPANHRLQDCRLGSPRAFLNCAAHNPWTIQRAFGQVDLFDSGYRPRALCLGLIARSSGLCGENELALRAKYGRWSRFCRIITQRRKPFSLRFIPAAQENFAW
jgi:hypothetical protein